MDYSQIYIRARETAWRILIKNRVDRLPIHVRELARSYNIQCMSYTNGAKIISALGLSEHRRKTAGFTVLVGERKLIFYDDSRDRPRRRWIIAHELGHHVLRHPLIKGDKGYYTLASREADYVGEDEEQEANAFAAELLAPFIVLFCIGAKNAESISELCEISLISAEFRMKMIHSAMNSAPERETVWVALELMLLRRFEKYIEEQL